MEKILKSYAELSKEDLYDIMNVRQVVFVVEQDCPYLDADYKDLDCHHYYYRGEEDQIAAYVRLVPEGVSYDGYCSIGRVVTSPSYRGQGLGQQIMEESIALCKELYPSQPIKISGQLYLEQFYTKLGFSSIEESYLEDDIPHIAMVCEG